MHLVRLFFLLIISTSVFSIQVGKLQYIVSEKEKRDFLYLTNDSDKPEALSLRVFKRIHDDYGVEKRIDTNDFYLYPEQVIVMPGTVKKVLINPTIDLVDLQNEMSYRILVNPESIDFSENPESGTKVQSTIKLEFSYILSLYAVPRDEIEKIEVDHIRYLPNSQMMEIILTNSGTVHKVLKEFKIDFRWDKNHLVLDQSYFTDKEINSVPLFNYNFLAGTKRRIHVPIPNELRNVNPDDLTAVVKL